MVGMLLVKILKKVKIKKLNNNKKKKIVTMKKISKKKEICKNSKINYLKTTTLPMNKFIITAIIIIIKITKNTKKLAKK